MISYALDLETRAQFVLNHFLVLFALHGRPCLCLAGGRCKED